jgi:hypothetical protein
MCDEGNGGVKKGWRRCMMNESLCLYLTLINCIDVLIICVMDLLFAWMAWDQ